MRAELRRTVMDKWLGKDLQASSPSTPHSDMDAASLRHAGAPVCVGGIAVA